MQQQKSRSWWRPIVVGACIAIAAVALVGSLVTRYIERNVLDTDGYLAIVGPLPQDPKVAAALAQFTTQRVFDATNAEANLKEFLPPRLAPLAGPLTETLEKRVTQESQDFVQSEAFDTIWTASNRLLQQGVVRLAESKQGEGKLAAVGSLDLSSLASSVRERLGDGAGLTPQQEARAAEIQINLRQRVDRLRTAYRVVTNGAYALPYVAVAFLAAALAIAFNRRRTIIAIGCTIFLLGIALLVALKIISGEILNEITDPVYKASAEVVYEAFYGDLRGRIAAATIVSAVAVLLALLAGPYEWARAVRGTLGLDRLKTWRWVAVFRRQTGRLEPWLLLAGAAATIIWLLALPTLTTSTLVVILSVFITYASVLHLIAQPRSAMISRHG
jgi:hypothetical protein